MKTFDEVFTDKTKYGVKVQTSEYGKQGKYIIIDQGQSQIAGYTDREEGVFEELPVIVFGDHTRTIKYVDKPFFLGADGVKVLRSKDNNANYKYLYYALKSAKIPDTGYNRHFKWLKKIQINYPDNNRQEKIVQIFDKASDIIKNRESEISALDELIKARFIEMFGDPVTNPYSLPIVTLGELSELITKGASPSWQGFSYTDDSTQTLFVTSENVRAGYMDLSSPKYIEDSFNDKQKRSVIHKGDFLINIVGASIGRAAQFHLDCKANMNQAAALVRVNDYRIRDKYLLIYLNSERAQRMYDSMKSDTGRANLSLQDISDLSILLPSIEQQIEFEIFVTQVDKSKVAVQKALDETQLLFDSLMQKYFG